MYIYTHLIHLQPYQVDNITMSYEKTKIEMKYHDQEHPVGNWIVRIQIKVMYSGMCFNHQNLWSLQILKGQEC